MNYINLGGTGLNKPNLSEMPNEIAGVATQQQRGKRARGVLKEIGDKQCLVARAWRLRTNSALQLDDSPHPRNFRFASPGLPSQSGGATEPALGRLQGGDDKGPRVARESLSTDEQIGLVDPRLEIGTCGASEGLHLGAISSRGSVRCIWLEGEE